MTSPARGPAEVLGVVVVAAALGAAGGSALLHGSSTTALLAVAAVGALTVMAGGRKVLLVVAFVDVSLQVDKHLFYDEGAADIGALGGLSLSLTTVVVLLLYAGWTADALARVPGTPRPQLRPLLPLGAYVAASLLSSAGAADPALSGFAAAMLVQTYLLALYVVTRVRDRGDVLLLVGWLLAGLALSAAVVSVEVLTSGAAAGSAAGPVRPGGTVGSANTAGSLCASLALVATGALLTGRTAPGWLRPLGALGLPVGLVGLVLTQSRGAWLGFSAGLVLLLAVAVRRRWLTASALLGLAACAALVLAPLWGTVASRLSSDDGGSAAARGPLNDLALQMLHDHPLTGVGLNNVGVLLPGYAGPEFSTAWLYTVHNKYLLVAAESGVIGLVAFLVFLVAALRLAARSAAVTDRTAAALAAGLGCALVSQVLHMSVDLFQNRAQVQLLWSVVALLVVLRGPQVAEPRTATRPRATTASVDVGGARCAA